VQYETDVAARKLAGVAPPALTEIAPSELDVLFAACMPRLAKTARRLVRTAEDSEDLLQDSLLSAFKNLNQFQGRSKFSTWLYSIVRNKAKMRLRKERTHPCCSLEEQALDGLERSHDNSSTFSPDAEETCIENERSRILRQTLMWVPLDYRVVIQVCDIEGLGCRDAAKRLGMTVPALKTRLHRARKSVAAKIRQKYRMQEKSCSFRPKSRTRSFSQAACAAMAEASANENRRGSMMSLGVLHGGLCEARP
jgi:RNA polymerase sigma-70 factor, ECF subfamily